MAFDGSIWLIIPGSVVSPVSGASLESAMFGRAIVLGSDKSSVLRSNSDKLLAGSVGQRRSFHGREPVLDENFLSEFVLHVLHHAE